MVDTGWYRHPYFVQRGYHANPPILGPAADNIGHDEVGHGTGESANIFAIAPNVEFTLVKKSPVNAVGAFNVPVALHPDIISCSWGSSVQDPTLLASDRVLGGPLLLMRLAKELLLYFLLAMAILGFLHSIQM